MGLITAVMPPPTADDYERMIDGGAPPSAVARHHHVVVLRRQPAAARGLSGDGRRRPAAGADERHAVPARGRRARARPAARAPPLADAPRRHGEVPRRRRPERRHRGAQRHVPAHTDTRGCCASTTTSCAALCRESHDAGWRIATHAIGDVAIDQMLDIYEALGPHPRGLGHRIEHLGLPSAAQLARAARLGVIAAPQTIFLHEPRPQLPRVPARRAAAALLSAARDARRRRRAWRCRRTRRWSRTTTRSPA